MTHIVLKLQRSRITCNFQVLHVIELLTSSTDLKLCIFLSADWDNWNPDETNEIDAMVDAYNEQHSSHVDHNNIPTAATDATVKSEPYDDYTEDETNLAVRDDIKFFKMKKFRF